MRGLTDWRCSACGVRLVNSARPRISGFGYSGRLMRITGEFEAMAVECRRGVASDRPTLEIIRRQAIESAFSDQYERNRFADRVATPDPNLAQWLEDDQFVVCVLETTVTPVAYGVASLDSGRIAAVYTSPDYQHRGYGTRVVDCLGTHLTTAGHAQMDVDAPEAAVPFFRTIGFECRGQASIDGPIPHMRLTKSLADTTSG